MGACTSGENRAPVDLDSVPERLAIASSQGPATPSPRKAEALKSNPKGEVDPHFVKLYGTARQSLTSVSAAMHADSVKEEEACRRGQVPPQGSVSSSPMLNALPSSTLNTPILPPASPSKQRERVVPITDKGAELSAQARAAQWSTALFFTRQLLSRVEVVVSGCRNSPDLKHDMSVLESKYTMLFRASEDLLAQSATQRGAEEKEAAVVSAAADISYMLDLVAQKKNAYVQSLCAEVEALRTVNMKLTREVHQLRGLPTESLSTTDNRHDHDYELHSLHSLSHPMDRYRDRDRDREDTHHTHNTHTTHTHSQKSSHTAPTIVEDHYGRVQHPLSGALNENKNGNSNSNNNNNNINNQRLSHHSDMGSVGRLSTTSTDNSTLYPLSYSPLPGAGTAGPSDSPFLEGRGLTASTTNAPLTDSPSMRFRHLDYPSDRYHHHQQQPSHTHSKRAPKGTPKLRNTHLPLFPPHHMSQDITQPSQTQTNSPQGLSPVFIQRHLISSGHRLSHSNNVVLSSSLVNTHDISPTTCTATITTTHVPSSKDEANNPSPQLRATCRGTGDTEEEYDVTVAIYQGHTKKKTHLPPSSTDRGSSDGGSTTSIASTGYGSTIGPDSPGEVGLTQSQMQAERIAIKAIRERGVPGLDLNNNTVRAKGKTLLPTDEAQALDLKTDTTEAQPLLNPFRSRSHLRPRRHSRHDREGVKADDDGEGSKVEESAEDNGLKRRSEPKGETTHTINLGPNDNRNRSQKVNRINSARCEYHPGQHSSHSPPWTRPVRGTRAVGGQSHLHSRSQSYTHHPHPRSALALLRSQKSVDGNEAGDETGDREEAILGRDQVF